MNSRLLLNQPLPSGNYPTEKTKCLQKIFGFTISVFASTLFLVLSILPMQNLHAQCGITPDPALQTSPIDIDISTSGTTVSLDIPILSSKGISAAAGPLCSPATLYLYPSHEDGLTPASAFTSFGVVNQPGFVAGSYYFNIDGEAFKTEVDQGGWVLIASSSATAGAASLSTTSDLQFQSNKILVPAVYLANPNIDITDIRITATSGPNTPFEAFTNHPSELADLRNNRTLSANPTVGNNWTGPSAAFMNKTCPGSNVALADRIYHACGNTNGMHWFPIDGMIKTQFNNPLENDLNLWIKGRTPLLSLPLVITCGDPDPLNLAALGSTYPSGTYLVISDNHDGIADATLTSDPLTINVSIIDNSDPTFVGGTCSAPAGGPFGTNHDGANNEDCRTAILGLMHPDTDDNCSGEILTVVYDNTNDPLNSVTPITVTEGTANTYQFYNGTTTVTYTVTDGNSNTESCSFDVTVADDEDPTFLDPTTDLQNGLSDELKVDYVGPVAGVHSGRARIFLNCNSPSFAADKAFAESFLPAASDNCLGLNAVTQLAGTTTNLGCTSVALVDNLYSRTTFNYEVSDTSTPPNDLSSAGNDPFRILIFIQDDTPPDFNSIFNTTTTTITVPVDPTNIHETTLGTAADPYIYSGGLKTSGTNSFITPPAVATTCGIDFNASITTPGDPSALAVIPDDCQTLTFTSSVHDGTNVVFTGNTNDIVTDNTGAGPMTTFDVGTYTIEYIATDPCGFTSEYSFTLEVVDDTSPVLDISATSTSIGTSPYSADPNGCETSIQYVAPSIMDNCASPGVDLVLTAEVLLDGVPTSIPVDQNAGGTPLMHAVELPVGSWSIRYILTDGVSTPVEAIIPITVEDNQPPVISCGADQVINSICADTKIPDYRGNITITDNCTTAGITVTQIPAPNTKLEDIPGLTLADGEQFMITLSTTPTSTPVNCSFAVTILDEEEPVPDEVPLPTINSSTTSLAECGTFLLAPYTAEDCDGTVIIGNPSNADGIVDTDNDNIPEFYIYNTGFHFVTWTYDDGNGNVATQTQSINILDDEDDPVFTFNNTNPVTRNTTAGECFRNIRPLNFLAGRYSDVCGVDLVEYAVAGETVIARTSSNDQVQLNKGSNIITFYATDLTGNEGSKTIEMIIEDNEAPVASLPTSITLNIGDANDSDPMDCAYTIADGSLVDPTATDNCAMPPLRTLTSLTETLSDGGTFSPPAVFDASTLEGYTFTVNNGVSAVFTATYLFNDGNGQTTNKTITITVVDNRQPDITCPTSTTRDSDGNCDYVVVGNEFDLTAASDNCTNTIQLSITNDYNNGSSLAGATFDEGPTTVIWTVTDLNGKTSTCSMVVEIEDNLEPTLNCVNINRNLLSNGTVTVDAFDFLSSIEDACSGMTPADLANFDIKINNQTGSISFDCEDATNMPIQVEISVTDLAGNEAICRPTITIQETIAPMANCVSVSRDLSATAPGMVTVTAAELNDGSTDNCAANTAGLIFSFTPSATNPVTSMDFDCDDTGSNSVNFYAIDASGNVSTACAANITIVDATSISVDCRDLSKTLNASGTISISAAEFNDGSTDNCGSTSTLTYTIQGIGSTLNLGCNNIGETDYVLEVFDGTNTSTCPVTLTLVDQTGPVADCQPVTVNLTGAGTQVVTADMFDLNSLDICSQGMLSFEFADGSNMMTVDCNDLGTNPITITVLDNYSNPTTCTTTLTVEPQSPAVFTAATVSGGTGATVDIDITADDYYEMVSWQFSGDIDPAFATINSISTSFGGIFLEEFDPITGEFQMAYSEFPAVTLGNGAVVATINVTLVSTVVGSSTIVNLKDGPLELEIAQGCSQAPQATDIDEATHLVDGQLNIANGQVTISGTIETDQGVGIPDVIIAVTGDVTLSTTTDPTGAYSVVVPGGSSVLVTPTKDTNHKNGISALDAALVQALASSPNSTTLLPTPTQRIAADPNTNQDISPADAGIIGFVNVISGATFHNPPGYDVNSWVFVDGAHVFTDPLDPWNNPYNDAITYTNVTTNQSAQDFTGIKIGNVIGTVDVTMLSENGDTRSPDLIFNIQDQAVESGTVVSIPLKLQSFQDLIAFQTTLNFDATALTFNSISTDLLDQNGNVALDESQSHAGLLPLSWFSGQSVNLEDQEIGMVLNFTANESLESLEGLLSISNDLINTAAWHSDQEAIGIDLKIEVLTTTNDPTAGFELFQNRPNPFRTNTLISFSLPEAAYGTLSIYDISGRLVYSESENYNIGYNEVTIDRSQLNNNGVFIYQFKTDKYAAIKKLTLLE